MGNGDIPKQEANVQIEIYKAYLEDLGRIGGRHENSRKFYISVMSALFVFLSMAGKNGPFVNVRGPVLLVVALGGMVVCVAWFQHMKSFGTIFLAKLGTLRDMEEDLSKQRSLKPFTVETEKLREQQEKPEQESAPRKEDIKFRYRPLTVLDRVIPVASAVLFAGLLLFKLWNRQL